MIRYATKADTVSASIAARPRCTRSIVERIADVICETAGSGQVVTADVFESRDIPVAVVERYAEQARDLARRKFVKRG